MAYANITDDPVFKSIPQTMEGVKGLQPKYSLQGGSDPETAQYTVDSYTGKVGKYVVEYSDNGKLSAVYERTSPTNVVKYSSTGTFKKAYNPKGKDSFLDKAMPFIQAAALTAATAGAGSALGGSLGISAPAGTALTAGGLQLAQGKDIGEAAKTAALAYGASSLANGAGGTGATTGGGGGGMLSGTASDAQFIAADAAQQAAQGLSSSQIATNLTAAGVDSMTAIDAAQLASQGLSATDIATNLTVATPETLAATKAGGGLFTEGGTAAAGGTAAGAGAAGSTFSDAALIKGGLSLAGGLLQGETASDAASTLATNQAKLAKETSEMGKFQPVGVTTRFGTSSYTTDPVTGAITPSYTLSPEAQAYQDKLAGIATSGLDAGKSLMSLGQQYVGESPEAVRSRYISTQQALLAPQQEQTLAALRTNQMNTGRSGLAFGATSDGLAATNPEMAAYYNSLAQTQRQLAANAETQYQNQVNFGTGLMGSATTPFTNAFTAQKSVETAGQQPMQLSTDFANTAATRGAAQGANYAAGMAPSLQSSYKATATDPLATFLTGLSDSDLAVWGLSKVK